MWYLNHNNKLELNKFGNCVWIFVHVNDSSIGGFG